MAEKWRIVSLIPTTHHKKKRHKPSLLPFLQVVAVWWWGNRGVVVCGGGYARKRKLDKSPPGSGKGKNPGYYRTTKDSGNITLYHPETVGVLQEIAERYRQRQTTDQIIEELRMSYGETFEMEPNYLPQRMGHAYIAPLVEIAKAMTALATQREETLALIEKQRRLEQRISGLEAKQKREETLQGFLSWCKNLWKRGS